MSLVHDIKRLPALELSADENKNVGHPFAQDQPHWLHGGMADCTAACQAVQQATGGGQTGPPLCCGQSGHTIFVQEAPGVQTLGLIGWSNAESEAARKHDHSLAQQLNCASLLYQFDIELTPTRAALPGFELNFARNL